jgi:hypothetical protein
VALVYDPSKHRPIKVILAVEAVRDMDKAILEQLGGYEDRHELVNEAIQQYLVELRTAVDDEPAATGKADLETDVPDSRRATDQVPEPPPATAPIVNLADTAVRLPSVQPALVENEVALVRREPLLGLHNADVPSIAAIALLGELSADGPVSVEQFYPAATERARALAGSLAAYEERHKVKLSALLPSNANKAKSAARGYQAFALGTIAKQPEDDGRRAVSGPLYLWNAAGLVRDGDDLKIGITEAGWRLLESLDGITFERPHSIEHARRFLAHLHEHAPADVWGFRTLLEAVSRRIGRVDLNAHFVEQRDWKESVATSVAQGYVARSREWGMVVPKLVDGRYELTTFGREMLNDMSPERAPGRPTGDDRRRREAR